MTPAQAFGRRHLREDPAAIRDLERPVLGDGVAARRPASVHRRGAEQTLHAIVHLLGRPHMPSS